jgi:hypothetical protein
MPRKQDRSFYFQEIARVFFGLRGAPFILSSRDMVTIASWEEKRIPLRVVLEGMERAFEKYRKRRGAEGRKMSSLAFCEAEILRAHAEHRDRGIGRTQEKRGPENKNKKKMIKIEVKRFLDSMPLEARLVEDVYREALAVLSLKDAPEDALERLDGRVEELIARFADAALRADVEKSVRAAFPGRPSAESGRIFLTELVRRWREKYRVPYLSPFYY